MIQRPRILMIDDEPENSPLSSEELNIDVIFPADLELEQITQAELILLDYKLGSWWPEDTPLACQPRDGLALMSLLKAYRHPRSEAFAGAEAGDTPACFALISGDLNALAPADVIPHHHLVARAHGLEWVFAKHDEGLERQVSALAQATAKLPDDWPDEPERAAAQFRQLLGLDESDDGSPTWSEVVRTVPPLYELSRATDGMAIIRWLLHRILPYPTFLWSTHQLAMRFRMDHVWMCSQLSQPDTKLAKLFEPARYGGILADFLGARWWGGKVEDVLWEDTDGKALSIPELHEWLASKLDTKPKTVPYLHPVVCLNGSYEVMDELADMDDCVRIMRDDWPMHADAAWMRCEQVRDDESLRSRVVESDVDKLDDEQLEDEQLETQPAGEEREA